MPIKNRAFLAWTGKNENQTPQQKVTGRPPRGALDPGSLFREAPGGSASVAPPASPQPLCVVSGEQRVSPSCRPSRPQHRRPPHRLCSGCAWASAREPRAHPACHTCPLVGVFTVLEATVLYQNRKGKATTFLVRFFFSQIYRIIAFIYLFIF